MTRSCSRRACLKDALPKLVGGCVQPLPIKVRYTRPWLTKDAQIGPVISHLDFSSDVGLELAHALGATLCGVCGPGGAGGSDGGDRRRAYRGPPTLQDQEDSMRAHADRADLDEGGTIVLVIP